jgi:DNA uptake protein ComE-like DNA-binding protein
MRHRRGFVLIMVLVVIMLASMVAASLLFVLSAEHTAAAAGTNGEQAWATAMSGVYQAMRIAGGATPGSTEWQDNPAVFSDQLVCDDGVRRWYFSVYDLAGVDGGGFHYGLTDEASKINVYRATQEMLEGLPGMTPDLAANLLGALPGGSLVSSSSTNQAGVAPPLGQASVPGTNQPGMAFSLGQASAPDTNQAGSLASPSPSLLPNTNDPGTASFFLSTNAPSPAWTCLDELLQVSGFTTRLLYGSYSNLTARVENQADMQAASAVFGPQDGQPEAGLRQYLTVSSYDLNRDSQGQPRINLNQTNADLSSLGLSTNTLAYLQALWQSGQQLGHPVELLEATNTVKDQKGNPLQLSTDISKDQLAMLLDRCAATNDARIRGLINLNTASAKVLAALPGMTEALAESIVAARVGLSAEDRKTPAWLYQEGILNADALKKVAPYLTTRSYQFHFLVAAYTIPASNYRVLEVVVDAAVKPPVVIFLRDVSRLGMPFTPTGVGVEQGAQTSSPSPNPLPEERVSQRLPFGNSNTFCFAGQRPTLLPLPRGEGRGKGELIPAWSPPSILANTFQSPNSSSGVARTKMLVSVPGKVEVWKTTEYTEYTENRPFSSVYSVSSVVSQSNGVAAKMASISRDRSETISKLNRDMAQTQMISLRDQTLVARLSL